MRIDYRVGVEGLTADDLAGFFAGWPCPPSPERRLEILRSAHRVVVAWDGGRVLGFVTAIGDGMFAAAIPLLEVLPDARGQGIGSELVRRLLAELDGYYMIDLSCDADLRAFYERLGFMPLQAMARRDPASLER